MLVNTWYINKSCGNGDIGWHSGLHAWNHYTNQGKAFCSMLNTIWALDDNTVETGCPIVLPGSHKRSFNSKEHYNGLDMPGSHPVILEPGDVLLFSEATMHGGLSRTTEGNRRNLYINYIEDRALPPLGDGNLHHYCLPPEVRARFSEEDQSLFKWMEYCTGA